MKMDIGERIIKCKVTLGNPLNGLPKLVKPVFQIFKKKKNKHREIKTDRK